MEYPCLLQSRNFGMDCSMDNEQAQQNKRYGGESGIRTHVTLSSKHAFQACAFSHSAISPALIRKLLLRDKQCRQNLLLRFYGCEAATATWISLVVRAIAGLEGLIRKISWESQPFPGCSKTPSCLSPVPRSLWTAPLGRLFSRPAARDCSGSRVRAPAGRLRPACHRLCADNSSRPAR